MPPKVSLRALLALVTCCAACRPVPVPAPPETAAVPAPAVAEKPPEGAAGAAPVATGAIEGVVAYTGTLADESVVITRDAKACTAHEPGTTRPAGTLIVADGRVANVVVWIDEGAAPSPSEAATKTVTIDNIGCAFVPRVSVGFVGGKVAAANSDPILHDTSLAYADDGTSIGHFALPGAGSRIERTLRRPGLVAVRCETHEWMRGWLHVLDRGQAAVTDARGAFELRDVPAGTHVVHVWHERLGTLEARVHVEQGATTRVELGYP